MTFHKKLLLEYILIARLQKYILSARFFVGKHFQYLPRALAKNIFRIPEQS